VWFQAAKKSEEDREEKGEGETHCCYFRLIQAPKAQSQCGVNLKLFFSFILA